MARRNFRRVSLTDFGVALEAAAAVESVAYQHSAFRTFLSTPIMRPCFCKRSCSAGDNRFLALDKNCFVLADTVFPSV